MRVKFLGQNFWNIFLALLDRPLKIVNLERYAEEEKEGDLCLVSNDSSILSYTQSRG